MAEDIIYLNHKTHPIKFINSLHLPLCSSSIADHYVTLPRKPRRYHAHRDSGVSSEVGVSVVQVVNGLFTYNGYYFSLPPSSY